VTEPRWHLRRPRGLRDRVTLAFSLAAFLISVVLAGSTYLAARTILIDQREGTATRQAYVDANFVRDRLTGSDTTVPGVLAALNPPSQSFALISSSSQWFTSALAIGPEALPSALRDLVQAGTPAHQRTTVGGVPAFVIGVPIPSVGADYYEVSQLTELDSALRVLSGVLLLAAAVTTGLGTFLGRRLSRLALQPLDAVAGTAAEIASGGLDTRLPPTNDPDLATIVGSFNSMVDALQQRIEREARFVGDVSHELRSPLTTLVTSVDVLQGRRDELPERSQRALDLVHAELDRFRRTLDDLLELARSEAGLDDKELGLVSLDELVRQTLLGSGRSTDLLQVVSPVVVRADKRRLERAVLNLLDNADRHGDGVVAVSVRTSGARALVLVDDAGAGVPAEERERIFERFARGPGGTRKSPGAGLGLALVDETARLHGGAVRCVDRPGGGARFVLSLPRAAR